jgi:hypothetical protein
VTFPTLKLPVTFLGKETQQAAFSRKIAEDGLEIEHVVSDDEK